MFMLGEIPEEAIAIVAVGGAFLMVMVGIAMGTVKSIARTRAREQTRREIAAYVAEGSMSAEDAARLLEAGDAEITCLKRHGGKA